MFCMEAAAPVLQRPGIVFRKVLHMHQAHVGDTPQRSADRTQ